MADTMTLEQVRDAIRDAPFTSPHTHENAVWADAIDAAIRERDRLRGDVAGMTEELLHVPSREEWRELQKRAERAEAELAESRETIKRLNRRVQVAEAGVAEKVKASGGSLGRALANAAASKAEAELAALKARMRPVARVENGEVRALMDPADEGKYVAVVVVEE